MEPQSPEIQPHWIPAGFRAAAVACGIKKGPGALDLALFSSDLEASAAGLFTTNQLAAAPVQWSRAQVPSTAIRAVVINSGNANACTGVQGWEDTRRMAEEVASILGCGPQQVLVCSTGVIGVPLPMDQLLSGIRRAGAALRPSRDAWEEASRAILTTDSRPKCSGKRLRMGGREVRILGVAKGAGMIAPRMATMLALVLTDASIEPSQLSQLLRESAEETFHCLSIDGHTSTNDTVLVLANAASAVDVAASPSLLVSFRAAITDVCRDLAIQIAADGEGASHLLVIDVEGAPDFAAARTVARAIAESPLVKTAVCGGDPNWGRIVSAAGYAGVALDQKELRLWLNGHLLFDRGCPAAFDPETVARALRENWQAHIRLRIGPGPGRCRFWSCDLTAEYVRINAEYTT
jgi:glutamate N-acetyltransferase/amino-acid N-acetyltransferase